MMDRNLVELTEEMLDKTDDLLSSMTKAYITSDTLACMSDEELKLYKDSMDLMKLYRKVCVQQAKDIERLKGIEFKLDDIYKIVRKEK